MNDQTILLGDVIFPELLENTFLRSLYESLLFNYAISTLSLDDVQKKNLDVESLLCFADLLSKSTDRLLRNQHINLAQEIASLLSDLYPDNPDVHYYLGSILSSCGNYRGTHLKANSFRNLILEEEYSQQIEKKYLEVPNSSGKYFFPEQKKAYDSLNAESLSFSAPTSLGKTFIITSFITSRIAEGLISNYAIVLPTKALIGEVSFNLGRMLRDNTKGKKYRILTNAIPSILDKNCSFIAVMTPEQLHHVICSNKNLHLDWLFIDEAYKISQKDNKRSGYYFDLIDEIHSKGERPHIVFASPGVPNPDLYLKMDRTLSADEKQQMTLSFSPVTQIKFLFNETSGELSIYNNITKKPIPVCEDKSLSYYGLISLMQDKGKKSIIYCGSKLSVANSAFEFMKFSKKTPSKEFEELSEKFKSKIHDEFWLADTVMKGIGYHMGYLPASIRNSVENSFRKTDGGLDVVFCTSTLLEGVNLPADNIFITSTKNGEEMTSLDFRNLIGRVGRIEYNLHGNVFLVHKKKSQTSLDSLKNLLEKPIETQEFAYTDVLNNETKISIIENLKEGKVGTPQITKEKDSRQLLERSLSNKLLKDIVTGKDGVLLESFNDVMTKEDKEEISKTFSGEVPVPSDIFISMDQNEKLYEKIKNGLNYPAENASQPEIQEFLEKLKDAFNWSSYEPQTLGYKNNIKHYAFLVVKWVNGADLKELISDDINGYEKYKREKEPQYKIREHKAEINKRISKILEEVDKIIGFKLCRYFQQFSQTYEYCFGRKPVPDWPEFLEYGSRFPTQIWLCKQGFTRDAAKLIAKKEKKYIDKSKTPWKLEWKNLLDSDEELIKEEATRVELFQSDRSDIN